MRLLKGYVLQMVSELKRRSDELWIALRGGANDSLFIVGTGLRIKEGGWVNAKR